MGRKELQIKTQAFRQQEKLMAMEKSFREATVEGDTKQYCTSNC